jgi:hypothetical protein
MDKKKIIDVQKCKILYLVNNYSFKKPFITPIFNYYKYCINFFNKKKYFNDEREKQRFLEFMKTIQFKFKVNYKQYFSDENLFGKGDNEDEEADNDDKDEDDDNNNNIKDFYNDISTLMTDVNTLYKFTKHINNNNYNKKNSVKFL